MKLTCLTDSTHKKFIATVHVTEDWVVNAVGEFEEVFVGNQPEVVHSPELGDAYTCAVCNAEARSE